MELPTHIAFLIMNYQSTIMPLTYGLIMSYMSLLFCLAYIWQVSRSSKGIYEEL